MEDNFVKLTNAVYRLLEFFPESEPLKSRAKERVLSIMENLTLVYGLGSSQSDGQGWVSIKDYLSGSREKAKLQILEDVDILLNEFKLAKSQNWLSDINYLIISNGYKKIKERVGRPALAPVILSEIAVAAGKAGSIQNPAVLSGDFKEKDKDHNKFSLSGRQVKILRFLEENEKAQVMDLIKVMPNVTKRTIRRDLDELLKAGKITRLGEYNQVFYKIS